MSTSVNNLELWRRLRTETEAEIRARIQAEIEAEIQAQLDAEFINNAESALHKSTVESIPPTTSRVNTTVLINDQVEPIIPVVITTQKVPVMVRPTPRSMSPPVQESTIIKAVPRGTKVQQRGPTIIKVTPRVPRVVCLLPYFEIRMFTDLNDQYVIGIFKKSIDYIYDLILGECVRRDRSYNSDRLKMELNTNPITLSSKIWQDYIPFVRKILNQRVEKMRPILAEYYTTYKYRIDWFVEDEQHVYVNTTTIDARDREVLLQSPRA